jgi:hypothetical protein
MSDFILGVWTVFLFYWLTWPCLLLSVVFISAIFDDDWPILQGFFVVVYSLSIKEYFEIPWQWFQFYLYAYVPIGLIWSMHRYRKYLKHWRKIYDDSSPPGCLKTLGIESYGQENAKRQINDFGRVVGKLVLWCYSWPINTLLWSLRDLKSFLKTLISVRLKALYVAIQSQYRIDDPEKETEN